MGNKFVPYFGVLIYLFIMSVPLLFVEDVFIKLGFIDFFNAPVTIIFYSLLSFFCFLESKVSFNNRAFLAQNSQKHFLPYFASASVLIVFWTSLYSYALHNYYHSYNHNALQIILASSLILSGILLRVLSIHTLNKYFISHVGLAKNHQLIKSGLYSIVRHPSELGLLLIYLGVPILMSSMLGLAIALLLVLPLSLYRISLEDKIISAEFGAEFTYYKLSVPALAPNLLQRKNVC